MIRTGVIGCGNIGKVHAGILNSLEGVSLCALADEKRERAQEYAGSITQGRAGAYGSLEELLKEEHPQAVHICTPHFNHVPLAVTALKAGVHVFMEKPPAISRKQFEELKEASQKSGARLGICFQNRFNETTKRVTALLAEGRLGKPRCARAFVTWNRNQAYYTESGWRGRLETEGGGVLINQAIHTLDLLLLWLGRPAAVEASMSNHHLKGIVEVEDTIEAYLAFDESPDPVKAVFYATTAYGADAPVFIELVCEKGILRLEGDMVSCQPFDGEPEIWKAAQRPVPGKAYWGSGHEACIRDFYDSLERGTPYANDLASVENTFWTMMDIYDSARNKER